jgi:DNA-binding NarL/FixJ family response regulator
MAKRKNPDLVMMDIMLKGEMDGIETVNQLRSHIDVPVVYLTAYADDNILQRAKVTEPMAYLVKPFKDRELHSAIEMALYKHRMEAEREKAYEELEMKVEERTAELFMANEVLEKEIEVRMGTELALIERRKELENKTHKLEELNAALKVLLKHRDEDKKDFEEKVIANVKKLVFPYIEKLNNSQLNDRQMVYLNIIKSNLEDIIAPFLHQLSSKYSDLTPNEIQVAGFVKEGKTTKEIAELLNSSTGAIDFHRNNLRKKLGLRNTKTNLRSFLLTFA